MRRAGEAGDGEGKGGSPKRKILAALYLEEELRGERRTTLFILAALIPAIALVTVFIAFREKFHLNSLVNLGMAAALGLYYAAIAVLLKLRRYKPFLKYVSTGVNVLVLTISICGYSIQSGWIHSMHTAVLSAYVLAIVAAGLYQNPAVPRFACGLSMAAYAAIALYGILVRRVPLSPVETFAVPAFSYDVLIWYEAILVFTAMIVSSLNSHYRRMLERSLSSEAYSRVVKRANAQKTRFFINLAHETKTPLTLISNYMENLAERHGDDPEIALVRDYVEKLKQDMVDFLDHEKLKRGIVFFDHTRVVNASRSLASQAFLFRELAARKGLGFEVDAADAVYARIDPAALDRIFGNLLDNAVKYTEKGGIRASLSAEGGGAVFLVEDTGPGVPEKLRKDIFKPFFQLSREKRNTQGIGMGLAIVKRIVEDAGGSIGIESASPRGARFRVALPPAAPAAGELVVEDGGLAERVPSKAFAELLPQGEADGRPVLFIVEDNRALLRFMQDRLGADYCLRYALDGGEALRALESPPKPDIIVSDVMMDGMDGYEFRERLSESEELAAVPFIFITALASYRHKLRALRKGAIDYLYKPFRMDELSAKIASILKVRDALSAANVRQLRRLLASRVEAGSRGEGAAADPVGPGISKRQIQIAALLRAGLERKEIGDRLGISLNTVNTQIRRMFEKCGVNNRVELLNILADKDLGS